MGNQLGLPYCLVRMSPGCGLLQRNIDNTHTFTVSLRLPPVKPGHRQIVQHVPSKVQG